VSRRQPASDTALRRIRGVLATGIGEERRLRRLSLRQVGAMADVAASVVHEAESGGDVSLDSYVRIAAALDMRVDATATPTRRRTTDRSSDLVHAAMGELEAARLRSVRFPVAIDEPYQHFQFSGRGDVVAWDLERSALLHIENRTRFPNMQEVAGSYNAKRAYLGAVLATRVGVDRWRSETHVIAALWSAEACRDLRTRLETIRSLCPDPTTTFDRWWEGDAPRDGRTSTMLIIDPAPEIGRRRRYVGLDAIAGLEPRYRDYADAARALRLVT